MTGRVERLALSLVPLPNESFASLITRIAYHRYRQPVATLLEHLGLGARTAIPAVSMTASEQARWAAALGLDEDEIAHTLLDRYPAIAQAMRPASDSHRRALAEKRVGTNGYLLLSRSRVCPLCLADGVGAFNINWRLPLVGVCPLHHVLLLDNCTTCRQPLCRHHRYPRQGLAFEPTLCGRSPTQGRPTSLCSADLRAVEPQRIRRGAPVTAAQNTYLDLLWSPDHAATVNEIHQLTVWIVRLSGVSALTYLTPETQTAFAQHVAHRDRRQAGGERIGSTYPAIAAVAAAVLPAALETALAPDDELSDRFESLLADVQVVPAPSDAATDRLGAALVKLKGRRHRRNLLRYRRLDVEFPPAMSIEHVPQLIWQREYEEHLAVFYSASRPYSFRAGCSASLALALGAPTVREAYEALGLPVAYTGTCQHARGRGKPHFGRALAAAAEAWLERMDGQPIDYAARRSALRTLITVPADFGGNPTTRNLAAAWLWAYLTSGDPALAPAAAHRDRGRFPTRGAYRFAVRNLGVTRRFITLNSLPDWGLELLAAASVR